MIKFVKSNAVAIKDKEVFNSYADGKITAKQGARRIKENNDLDEVSEDDFIRMARWLGYR
ncbi:hypothetical protein [Holdemania massiliensis]|uniref:hypothetical protein n=1 Tax=Holdemania massiliensis TaxID=1468449 RepID=UPI00242D99CA|nr:hypothetical protein [Holdemania massiliensis]